MKLAIILLGLIKIAISDMSEAAKKFREEVGGDTPFDPECKDDCVYVQRYKSIFHFIHEESEEFENNLKENKLDKHKQFKEFSWKVLEVKRGLIIVFENNNKSKEYVLFLS